MVKFSSNDIFWILLFLYYSFGVEKTKSFIRSRGSLENHTQFKTIIYPFSDENGSKTIPFGAAHTYIACIGEYPPPGASARSSNGKNKFFRYSFGLPVWTGCPRIGIPHLFGQDPNNYVRNSKFKLGYFIRLCEHFTVACCNE